MRSFEIHGKWLVQAYTRAVQCSPASIGLARITVTTGTFCRRLIIPSLKYINSTHQGNKKSNTNLVRLFFWFYQFGKIYGPFFGLWYIGKVDRMSQSEVMVAHILFRLVNVSLLRIYKLTIINSFLTLTNYVVNMSPVHKLTLANYLQMKTVHKLVFYRMLYMQSVLYTYHSLLDEDRQSLLPVKLESGYPSVNLMRGHDTSIWIVI